MKNLFSLPLLLLACAAPAAALDWEFGSSALFESGKYGGTRRVASVYVPLTLKRAFADTDLSLTVPFTRQSSVGPVTRVGGRMVRVAPPGAAASRGAQAGAGDVLARGTYLIKRDGPGSFGFSLGGRLKFPTADDKKGLGTGELDQGAGFEFSKVLNPRWTLLADGWYTIVGDPAGVDFNNQLDLSVGFRAPLEGGLDLLVLYGTSSAVTDGNADPRELRAELAKTAGARRWSAALSLGLSSGSPVYVLGAGLFQKF